MSYFKDKSQIRDDVYECRDRIGQTYASVPIKHLMGKTKGKISGKCYQIYLNVNCVN